MATAAFRNLFFGFILAVSPIFLLTGCSVRTQPSVFEDRLLAYSVAAQSQDMAALNRLLLQLDGDLDNVDTRRDVKLFALRSETAKQLALLTLLAEKEGAEPDTHKYLNASLRDAAIAMELASRMDASDWIKPSAYNNVGDLLALRGMIADKAIRKLTPASAPQRREAFATAAMYHLAALAFHLQAKLVSSDVAKNSKEPSSGIKLEVSRSEERTIETLSRALNDLGEVLSPARRSQIIKQAEEGKPLSFLSNFSLSPQTHNLAGFLLAEKSTERKDADGCLAIAGQSARHYAVGTFFSGAGTNAVNDDFRISVIRFVACLNLDGGG